MVATCVVIYINSKRESRFAVSVALQHPHKVEAACCGLLLVDCGLFLPIHQSSPP